VAVGANQRVGIGGTVFFHHAAREVFHVDLVHDADAGRHHLEGVERLHAPFQELVAFLVALEFDLHVEIECIGATVFVDLNGMVNHHVHRHQGLDFFRVLVGARGGRSHGGKVGQQGHAGEILQQNPRHGKGNLLGAFAIRLPVRQLLDVFGCDFHPVAIAQDRLQHDADRHRQTRDRYAQCGFEFFQRGELNVALAGGKGVKGVEGVGHGVLAKN